MVLPAHLMASREKKFDEEGHIGHRAESMEEYYLL